MSLESKQEAIKRIKRIDRVYFTVAALCMAAFVWLYPREYPDAQARYELSEGEVIARAETFLNGHGYQTQGMEAEVLFRRTKDLHVYIQEVEDRDVLVRIAGTQESDSYPVHHWSVRWENDDDTQYRLLLSPSGHVYYFDNETTYNPLQLPADSVALRYMLPEGADVPNALFGPQSAQAFERIARYHLAATPFGDAGFQVDTLIVPSDRGIGTASVRFSDGASQYGVMREMRVDVTRDGALLELDSDFERGELAESGAGTRSRPPWYAMSRVYYAGSVVLYGIGLFAIAILFFRRFGARLVDTPNAARDAIILGTLGGAGTALFAIDGFVSSGAPLIWMILGGLATMAVAGAGMAFIALVVSGAADSVTRESGTDPYAAWRLGRQGQWRLRPVGWSVLRGLGLAAVLLGVTSVGLALFDGVGVLPTEDSFTHQRVPSPFLATLGMKSWTAFLHLSIAVVAVGALLRRRFGTGPVYYITVGLLFGLTFYGVDLFTPAYAGVAASVIAGLLFGWAYVTYDFLTVFLGYLFAELIWQTSLGWALTDFPMWIDATLTWGAVATFAAVGFIGVFKGRRYEDMPAYEPAYIRELSRQQRLERELEIARDVQTKFLPQEMPDVEGLDVAALCEAAQEVGGDYYDFIPIGSRQLGIVIGDVSGKGIQAAFYMTLVKGFVRSLCMSCKSPAEVLRRTNELFLENVPRGTFISMIFGVLDLDEMTFTFARAGHNPVLLKRSPSQIAEPVMPAGLGIGLAPGPAFDRTIEESEVSLRAGDVLVFYTDGFPEAMDESRRMFGEDELAERIGQLGTLPAREILNQITSDVRAFMGDAEQHDDMTMIVVKTELPVAAEVEAVMAQT